jgi:hypothetical protein
LLKQNGPLVVEVATSSSILRYTDGVFTQCEGQAGENASRLAMLLFGFKGEEYWLIQAPFGLGWGYLGNMKVGIKCLQGLKMGQILFKEKSIKVQAQFDPTQFYSPDPN